MKRLLSHLLGLSVLSLTTGVAIAVPISPSDFGAGATTTTFDGLGLPAFGNPTPFELDGNVYTTDDGIFRYLSPTFCFECFATNTDLGFINIELGTPVDRAGLFIGPGANDPGAGGDFWSATASFFDESDTLLGSIMVSGGDPAAMEFAGWEDFSGIAKILVTDTSETILTMINDVTIERIPEPGTIGLLGIGLLGMLFVRHGFGKKS